MALNWTSDSLPIGGELSEKPVCVFNTLSKLSDKPEVFNYLDKDKGGKYTSINKNDMIKEIVELHKNCVWWDPILNNCEHVLAYVRYGKKQLPEVLSVWSKLKSNLECFTQIDVKKLMIFHKITFAHVFFMQCKQEQ